MYLPTTTISALGLVYFVVIFSKNFGDIIRSNIWTVWMLTENFNVLNLNQIGPPKFRGLSYFKLFVLILLMSSLPPELPSSTAIISTMDRTKSPPGKNVDEGLKFYKPFASFSLYLDSKWIWGVKFGFNSRSPSEVALVNFHNFL